MGAGLRPARACYACALPCRTLLLHAPLDAAASRTRRYTVTCGLQAEDALGAVQSEVWRQSSVYLLWAARVKVMTGKASAAWQLYLELDGRRGDDARALLNLIADECFAMGHFYHSCKAFQVRSSRRALAYRLTRTAKAAVHASSLWQGAGVGATGS